MLAHVAIQKVTTPMKDVVDVVDGNNVDVCDCMMYVIVCDCM